MSKCVKGCYTQYIHKVLVYSKNWDIHQESYVAI